MPLRIRPYRIADVPGLLRIQSACFPPPYPPEQWWSPEQIASHVAHFPAGALCAELDGELVGSATALIVRDAALAGAHTWQAISAGGWITTHDPQGEVLYGIDVAVLPAHRGRGIARALYAERFALVRRLGLLRFAAGSRLSGYAAARAREPGLSVETYAAAVIAGTRSDPVVTPQLRAGLRPCGVVPGYLSDAESADCALLMEWRPA